jgi:alpha-1,6-mannosyltransferase
MASNILTALQGDLAEVAPLAREHALQFSWDQSMERLFGRVYRSAMARAAARTAEALSAEADMLVGA